MNSRKLLNGLLLSLGIVALATSCGKPADSTNSEQPSASDTETPASESNTVKPSEESVAPSESESVAPSESESVAPSESESELPSESESELPSESESEEPIIDENAVVYDVEFNYNDSEKLAVWTGFEIDGTIGETPRNGSHNETFLEDRYTIGNDVFGTHGYYTFAVDEQGYIVYASFSLGAGYGSPSDGYYHNQNVKNYSDNDYFVIGDLYQSWSDVGGKKTVDLDGDGVPETAAWGLYDFVIPEGGFVITAWHQNAELANLWHQLFGEDKDPAFKNLSAANNGFFDSAQGNAIASKSLDHFYVSLNDDHNLVVTERTTTQIKDDTGAQEDETPALNFTDAGEAVQVYDDMADAIVSAGVEADKEKVYTVKGVVTSFYADGSIVVEDTAGNHIVAYGKNTLGTVADGNYKVGDTVVVSGTMTTYKGLVEMMLSSAKKIEKYGKLSAIDPTTVTAENAATMITVENQSAYIKVVAAVVKSIDEKGSSIVTIGDVDYTLFKVDFPDNVQVGDTIDFTGVVSVYTTAQIRVDSADLISRYFNVTVDVDGDGEIAPVTKGYATGESVTLKATVTDGYIFSKWVKVSTDENGDEVLVDYSNNAETTYIVDGEDASFKAVIERAPWTSLDETYYRQSSANVKSINADAGGDAIAVQTNSETVFHKDGAWTGGTFNSSWRGIAIFDAEGRLCYYVYCPANGYGGPAGNGYYCNSAYADYTTNPAIHLLEGYDASTNSGAFELVVPEGGFIVTTHGNGNLALISALTNSEITAWDYKYNAKDAFDDNIRAFYNPVTNKVVVYNVLDEETQVRFADDANITKYNEGTTIYDGSAWINGVWANYMIVDGYGRIAYSVWNVGCGYGRPADGSYYTNPVYAENNPCFVTEGDVTKIVVPNGFTGLYLNYGYLDNFYSALTYGRITHTILDVDSTEAWALKALWNSKDNPYIAEDARVIVDSNSVVVTKGTMTEIEEPEEFTPLVLSNANVNAGDTSLSVFTTNEALTSAVNTNGANKWVANGWRTFLIVDAEGKIALFSWNAAYCGLNPTSDWFARHSDYATNNPAFAYTYEEDGTTVADWTFAIPEGGYAISMHTNNIEDLFTTLGLGEPNYLTSSTNVDEFRIVVDADAKTVTVNKA